VPEVNGTEDELPVAAAAAGVKGSQTMAAASRIVPNLRFGDTGSASSLRGMGVVGHGMSDVLCPTT
jgi:hypothetical protein